MPVQCLYQRLKEVGIAVVMGDMPVYCTYQQLKKGRAVTAVLGQHSCMSYLSAAKEKKCSAVPDGFGLETAAQFIVVRPKFDDKVAFTTPVKISLGRLTLGRMNRRSFIHSFSAPFRSTHTDNILIWPVSTVLHFGHSVREDEGRRIPKFSRRRKRKKE